jgi:hypothetical protein
VTSTQEPEEPRDEITDGGAEAAAARPAGRGRRRTPLAVASVAAAVLVLAGGGAYLAAGSDAGGGKDGAQPLTAGPRYDRVDPGGPVLSSPGGPVLSSVPPPRGIAPGEPDPRGLLYRAEGELPDGPGSARVYDGEAAVTADRVAALAKALQVPGTPHTSGQFWEVGTVADGSGPLLRVQKAAPGTWTFSRSAASAGSDNCAKGKPCPGTVPDPGGIAHPSGGAVSEAAAERAAAPVLDALGQGGAHLDAHQLLGAVRVVNADPVVAGLPTYGWTTGLQVGADGRVAGGGGQLTVPRAGASYPVTGAAQALKALNEAASGITSGTGGCATAEPLGGGPVTGAEPLPSVDCASRPPAGGRTVPVDSVVFGLAARPVDGRSALVPSWLFTVDPGGGAPAYRLTQPAVTSALLDPPQRMRPGGGSGAGDGAGTPPASGAPSSGTGGRADQQGTVSYSTHGRDLTVRFWGGVCGTYGMRADESGSAVKVRLDKPAPKPGEMCVAMAKLLSRTVTLERPVGGRDVVDATTGAKLPHATPSPAS